MDTTFPLPTQIAKLSATVMAVKPALRRIVIVGARTDGHGKVVLEILEAMKDYEIVGFLDDDPAKSNLSVRGYPVLGDTRDLPEVGRRFGLDGGIVAIANNKLRRMLSRKIQHNGLKLINAIHPTVHLDSDVSLGKGVVLCQGVIIVTGSRVGDCVNIHTGTTIDHDNILEDGVNVGPGVHTAGRVQLCRDVFVGTGASFIPDIRVAESAVVGAGAVVIRDVESNDIVAGVPARSIKKKGEKEG